MTVPDDTAPTTGVRTAGSGTTTRRAVVTGAAGFLGRSFVQRLKGDGWEVTGVDVRPGPLVVSGDVTRRGDWVDLLHGADLVVHTAALLAETGDERAHWDVNVGGTRTVANACLDAGVGRMLHLSSAVVLGRGFPDGAEETHPVRASGNPYTDSKIAAEHQALMVAARGLPLVIVRPLHVYGPHSTQWTVRIVQLIDRNLFVLVDGGEGIMTPTYVDDLVEGALLAATSPAGAGEVFHITGGAGVTAATFFGAYGAMLDRTLPSLPRAAAGALTVAAEKVMRPLGLAPPFSSRALEFISQTGTPSIDKAQRLLGWSPRVTLDAGMAATETWLRDVRLITRD